MWDKVDIYSDKMMNNRSYNKIENDEIIKIYKNENDRKCLIWYFKKEKLNIESLREYISILENRKINHGIIIYQNIITSSTKKILSCLYKYEIELFNIKEFQYDLTKFKYYCHHERCNEQEKKEIKNHFKNQLPILLKTDVISRYYKFEKNDIIKIHRKNGSIIYRIVK